MIDEDVRLFRSQLKALQRRLRQERASVNGLSRSDLQVLGVTSRGKRVTPRQVADELHMTTSNVAASLRELQSAGLIARDRDAEDGRRVHVSLTAEGAKMVADFRRERDTWLGRAITAQLNAGELRELLRAGELMERLAAYNEPEHAGADSDRQHTQ